MYFYQIKLVLKENKLDEFIECLDFLTEEFQKEKGYVDHSFCQDVAKKNTYNLIGEWKTGQDIENHFKCEEFKVLIGAARVLGENMKLSIGKTKERGGFQLAKDKIVSQPNQDHSAGK